MAQHAVHGVSREPDGGASERGEDADEMVLTDPS